MAAAFALIPGAPPADAHEDAPRFEMPFACGQVWQGATYSGHGDNDLALDFNQGQGNADLGLPVVASASGVFHRVVNEVGGNSSNLDHGNGWITIYGHLDSYAVADGTPVARGQVVGYVGNTGRSDAPHLHYEQRENDVTRHVAFSNVHIGEAGSQDPGYSYIYNGPDFTSRNCGRDPLSAPAVASLPGGYQLFASISAAGKLVTRLKTPEGWERKVHRGDLRWRNVDVLADAGGRLWIVAVDSSRQVWARRWTVARGWRQITEVASGFSQDTTPSIAQRPGGGITVVGVDTSRNLEQYEWTAATGWDFVRDHGSGWERAAIVAAGEHQWLVAVKPDGDVEGRSWSGGSGWSAFEEFGTGSWAISVPPAAAVRNDGTLSLFMVKADGRLYQRNWTEQNGWTGFWPRNTSERWLSVEAGFSDGVIFYVGQTYDRSLVSGWWKGGAGWTEGVDVGGPEWSAMRPVGLGSRPNGGVTVLGVTTDGELLHRHWNETRGWFAQFGRPGGATTWAKA